VSFKIKLSKDECKRMLAEAERMFDLLHRNCSYNSLIWQDGTWVRWHAESSNLLLRIKPGLKDIRGSKDRKFGRLTAQQRRWLKANMPEILKGAAP
jgi:hypothetical protein